MGDDLMLPRNENEGSQIEHLGELCQYSFFAELLRSIIKFCKRIRAVWSQKRG